MWLTFQGETQKAEEALKIALGIAKELLGKSVILCCTQAQLAKFYFNHEQYKEAEELIAETQATIDSCGDKMPDLNLPCHEVDLLFRRK